MPEEIDQFIPGELFALDHELFAKDVRTTRKGAAPGPSSMTADHLRPWWSMRHFRQFSACTVGPEQGPGRNH